MGFNLGAFAGGIAQAGVSSYKTQQEIALRQAAEERDKIRFAEEQRQIQQRIGSEEIQRQATIPSTGGTSLDEVARALPIYAGAANGGRDLPENYGATFKETFDKLTPQQQEMVLRGYGDAATPGGRVIADAAKGDTSMVEGEEVPFVPKDKERFAGLAALNLGSTSVRQGAEGNYAVQPIADEKDIIANHKRLAMQSGNPVAIKAAQDAEISYLTREVGKQNITLNDYNIKKAESAQKFKEDWVKEMQRAKEDHFELMKKIDTALTDPNVSLDNLVSKFGPQLKDVTGQSYSVKDGKIVTVGADGVPTIVASDINQAGQLLKEAAANHFGLDFQNRVLSKGLFETPADLAAFIKDKQDFFIKTGTLATARLSAQAAQTSANAAASNAATSASELQQKITAGLFPAQAKNYEAMGRAAEKNADSAASNAATSQSEFQAKKDAGYFSAQAKHWTDMGAAAVTNAANTKDHYAYLKQQAEDKKALDAETRADITKITDAYEKLSPADQQGEKGQALMVQGAMTIAKKSGDITGVLNAMRKPDRSGAEADWSAIEKSMYANSTPPDQIAAARTNFFASRGFAPTAAVSAVMSGVMPDGKPLTEADVDNFNRQFPNSKVDKASLSWIKPGASSATTTTPSALPASTKPAASKSAVERGIPLRSTDGGKTYTVDVPETIKDPSVKYYKEIPNPAYKELNGKTFKSAAEAEAAYNAATGKTAIPTSSTKISKEDQKIKDVDRVGILAKELRDAEAMAADKNLPEAQQARAQADIASLKRELGREPKSKDTAIPTSTASSKPAENATRLASQKEASESALRLKREDLFVAMDTAEKRLAKDSKNGALEDKYKAAKKEYDDFMRDNKLKRSE